MKIPIPLIATAALLLGCLPFPRSSVEYRQWHLAPREEWLPAGFQTPFEPIPSLRVSSTGRLPDSGPVRLFIAPTELSRTPPTGAACDDFSSLLIELGRPRWVPPPDSRVQVVDREAEADWVLESRLEHLRIERIDWPKPKREWFSVMIFRVRERPSDRLLWGCYSAPEPSHSTPARAWVRPEQAEAKVGLEARLGRHWADLQQQLDAALNGSPGHS